MIVEGRNLISQARATMLMISFTRGDRIGFQVTDGRMLECFPSDSHRFLPVGL